jgi:glycerol uptake facilitator protein
VNETARRLAAEALGTFLLVLFGTGSVATAVLTGTLVGTLQVAAVWIVGVAAGIAVAAPISGAHLNPAVTLAFALRRRDPFPARLVLPYWAAQLIGAIVAGLVVLAVFGPLIAGFEATQGIVRGAPGSERSAMVFGQYFPNPAVAAPAGPIEVSPFGAMLVEALGTAVLVLVIFALTDPDRPPVGPLAAVWIGLTVGGLICIFAPLTQAGWNPARDLGPRLVAALAGWGWVALPGPHWGFWTYLMGPLLGGPLGGLLYEYALVPRSGANAIARVPPAEERAA